MTYRRTTTTHADEEQTEITPQLHHHEEAEDVSRTTYEPFSDRRRVLYRWPQAVYLVFGGLEGLIVIRFVLRLLGANPGAPFTSFIYSITFPFVAPFYGVFGTPAYEGVAVEPHSLLALAMYALLAWLLVQLLWLLFAETRSAVSTHSVRHYDR